jgi:hypothetical protein
LHWFEIGIEFRNRAQQCIGNECKYDEIKKDLLGFANATVAEIPPPPASLTNATSPGPSTIS